MMWFCSCSFPHCCTDGSERGFFFLGELRWFLCIREFGDDVLYLSLMSHLSRRYSFFYHRADDVVVPGLMQATTTEKKRSGVLAIVWVASPSISVFWNSQN